MTTSRHAFAGVLAIAGAATCVVACSGRDLSTPESTAQALADAQCEFKRRCCGERQTLDRAMRCVERAESDWLGSIESRDDGEYRFDPACAQALLSLFESESCDFLLDITSSDQSTLCEVGYCWSGFFHGSKQEGEACSDPRACDGPLQCLGGYCQSPCGLSRGGPCTDEDGLEVRACRQGNYCDLETGRCSQLPGVGQPCARGSCEDGAYCSPETSRCAARKVVGEACVGQDECAEGLCWEERCTRLPDVGDDCLAGSLCDEDLYCDDDQRCERLPTSGEPCLQGSTCARGYYCEIDTCRAPESALCAL